MTQTPTLLAVLLDRRGLDRYGTFRPAYEQAARAVGPRLARSAPSRAQFHRWTSGELRGLPYTDHCRVLERMLSGYSAARLFQPCPDRMLPAPERAANDDSPAPSVPARAGPAVSSPACPRPAASAHPPCSSGPAVSLAACTRSSSTSGTP